MREGWTYKKWADVLTIINGKNQTAVESKDGEYPIYGSGGIMGYANNWLCPENCVVIGRKGNINKPIFVTTKFWNVDTAFGLNAHDNSLLPKFLFYFCQDYNFERHNKAVTIPSLTKADLLKINIPIPSLSEQQAIVSELDKINELISLKKAQLSDLDNLAQSIFYDMFGDPTTNEKEWEVKTIEDICSSIVRGPFGSALKKEYFVEPGETTYKVYEQKHAIQKDASIGSYYVTKEKFDELSRFEIKANDIIMSCSGTIGELFRIPNSAEKGLMNQALLKFTLNESVNYHFFFFMMEYVKKDFTVRGTGLQNIGSVKIIKEMSFGLPPLPLQQEFAKRIELIEQQKAQISSTIKDLETLLASRMQYWFD